MRDSYVPNFKVPGPRKPSGRMWVTILMCVILPPVGLVMLWGRTRCPIRGKVLMTLISVAVMVAVIALVLRFGRTPGGQSIYSTVEPTPVAFVTPPPESVADTPDIVGVDPQSGAADPVNGQDSVVPANPAG